MDGSRGLILRRHGRDDVVAAALGWVGTPYQHQATAKGAGCDCLGLIRGVWRELYGPEPESPPPYTPDWAELSGADALLQAARRHLREGATGQARHGDVLLFRMTDGAPAKHAAILDAPDRLIQAYWGRAVSVTAFVPWWRRRLAYAFSFPGADDAWPASS